MKATSMGNMEKRYIQWNTQEDSQSSYDIVKGALNSAWETATPPVNYLLSAAEVALRTKDHPGPSPIQPQAAVDGMTATNRQAYMARVKMYKDDLMSYEKATITLKNDYTKAAAILRDFFAPGCVLSDTLERIAENTHDDMQARFVESYAAFQAFIPNTAADRDMWMKSMEVLTDNDGRGFALFYADFNRYFDKLTDLGQPPHTSQIRHLLTNNVTNPNFLQNKMVYLMTDNNPLMVPLPGQPPHWKVFLNVCLEMTRYNPKIDLKTSPRVSIAERRNIYSATQGSNSSDNRPPTPYHSSHSDQDSTANVYNISTACHRCGRTNHSLKECKAKTCQNCDQTIPKYHDARNCTNKSNKSDNNNRPPNSQSSNSFRSRDNNSSDRHKRSHSNDSRTSARSNHSRNSNDSYRRKGNHSNSSRSNYTSKGRDDRGRSSHPRRDDRERGRSHDSNRSTHSNSSTVSHLLKSYSALNPSQVNMFHKKVNKQNQEKDNA